jgi:hypothetical protein
VDEVMDRALAPHAVLPLEHPAGVRVDEGVLEAGGGDRRQHAPGEPVATIDRLDHE